MSDFQSWQQQIEAVTDATDQLALAGLAGAADATQPDAVVDTIASCLSATSPTDRRRVNYWILLDKLCKANANSYAPTLTRRLVSLASEYAPEKGSTAFPIFLYILDSMRHFLGAVVAVAKAKIGALAPADENKPLGDDDISALSAAAGGEGDGRHHEAAARDAGRSSSALVLHRAALSTMGAFMSRKDKSVRTGPVGSLQVRTRDSVAAMRAANAYAPAMAVEVAVAPVMSDADAGHGYRQALPANHLEEYRLARQKRLRETFEQTRRENEERQNKKALSELEQQARGGGGAEGGGAAGSSGSGTGDADNENNNAAASNLVSDLYGGRASLYDFSDVVMPAVLPRDEFGVQIGNYPLGVRFLREAIRACGGALELETIVQRLSTLSGVDKDKFGNVREFVTIHSPTFIVQQEKERLVVRVREPGTAEDEVIPPTIKTPDGQLFFTWERITCPLCGRDRIRGRNLARHMNCRRCVKGQLARAVAGEPTSDIGLLYCIAVEIIANHRRAVVDEGFTLASGAVFDDGDLEYFEQCLRNAAKVRRYQFSSTRLFAPILRAIFIVRGRWLAIHNVTEVRDIRVGPSDYAFVRFFATLGALVHRLPIAWIELGDIVDMCRRFCQRPLPAHNPPPRPADPRIQMTNEFPGLLFCDSEIESEDEVSAEDNEACSDEEQEQFVLAPPVSVVESIMTVGFPRDTRKLEYRLRTRPPLVLRKALKLGGNATQAEAYRAKEE